MICNQFDQQSEIIGKLQDVISKIRQGRHSREDILKELEFLPEEAIKKFAVNVKEIDGE
jgi:hypothetical protein